MNSLIITMKTPKPYGWFHLMFLGFLLIGIILILRFLKPNLKKKDLITDIFLGCVWGIMVVGEIQKQYIYFTYGNYGVNIIRTFAWNNIPWHFCSTPLYVLPLALFSSKKSKLREVALTYLATFAILGGGLATFVPTDMFRDRLANSIQTMVHHVLMVLTGIFIYRTKQVGNWKTMLLTCYMFLYFVLIAVLLNVIFAEMSNYEIETFYMAPHRRTVLPILANVQQIGKLKYLDLGYLFSLILYTSVFPSAVFLVWFFGRNFNIITAKIHKGLIVVSKGPRALYINLSIFILGNAILNLIIYSPLVLKTWDFNKFNAAFAINRFLGDIFFLTLISYLILNITKNAKARHFTLLGISCVLNIFNIVQVLLTINHGGPITESINNNLISHSANLNTFFVKKLFMLFLPSILIGIIISLVYKELTNTLPLYSSNYFDIQKSKKMLTFNKLLKINKVFMPLIALSLLILFAMNQTVGAALANVGAISDEQKTKNQLSTRGVYGYYLGLPFEKLIRATKINYPKDEFHKYNTSLPNYLNYYNEAITNKNTIIGTNKTYNEIKELFNNKNIITMELSGLSPLLPLIKDPRFSKLAPNVIDFLNQSYHLKNFYSETTDNPEDSLYTLNHGLNPYNVSRMNAVLNNNLVELLNNKGYNTTLLNFYHNSDNYINYALKYKYQNYHLYSNNKYLDNEYSFELLTPTKDQTNVYNIYKNTWFNNIPEYEKNQLSSKHSDISELEGLSQYYNKNIVNPIAALEYLKHIFKQNFKTSTNNYVNFIMDLPIYPNTNIYEHDKGFGVVNKKYPSKHGKTNYLHTDRIVKNKELDFKLKKATEKEYLFLQYIGLIDRYFKKLKDVITSLDNTIFMIYTSKNNTILSRKTITKLFSEKKKKYLMNTLLYKEHLNKQFAFIYAPDKSKDLVNGVYPGFIKGENNLVRSLSDIYATITAYLDIETKLFQMGVNILTNLKKIVINPKDLIIYSDYYQTTLGYVNTRKRNHKHFKYVDLSSDDIDYNLVYSSLENIQKVKQCLDYVYNTKNYNFLYKD